MSRNKKAIFAAGCFWGVQDYFDHVPGVVKTTVGYTGGHTDHPTYEEVSMHKTGHAEAVELEFDPQKVSYETLVRQLFRIHDPTQVIEWNDQVYDNYRSAIFYTSNFQKTVAEKIKKELTPDFDKPIVTEISKASHFWPAESYHQKFTAKTGFGSCHIAYTPLK